MQFGIALPHIGPLATPEAIVKVACKAEALGFDSLWALDRLLWPLQPTSKYPGNPQGKLPAVMQNTYKKLKEASKTLFENDVKDIHSKLSSND